MRTWRYIENAFLCAVIRDRSPAHVAKMSVNLPWRSNALFRFFMVFLRLASFWLVHSGFKRLKTRQNKFTWCDFTSLSKQVLAALHNFRLWSFQLIDSNQSFSNCCRHKYDQSIKHCFGLVLGGILQFGQFQEPLCTV